MYYDVIERLRLNLRDIYFFLKSSYQKSEKKYYVILNSYPKSGTHLLSQILQKLTNINYWNDIVSFQSLSGVSNTRNHIKWKILSCPKNSLLRSHLMYDSEVLSILNRFPQKRFFIYRDPRDVALSHANWVMKEPLYFLHNYYKFYLKDDYNRIMASIVGIPIGTPVGSNICLPDIGADFKRWFGWLRDSNTFCIKFEDLVGARGNGDENRRYNVIRNIMEYLEINRSNFNIENDFNSFAMDPNKSHTFRKGQGGSIGKWKKNFTSEHKSAFKKYAGNLLIDLQYEDNFSW